MKIEGSDERLRVGITTDNKIVNKIDGFDIDTDSTLDDGVDVDKRRPDLSDEDFDNSNVDLGTTPVSPDVGNKGKNTYEIGKEILDSGVLDKPKIPTGEGAEIN